MDVRMRAFYPAQKKGNRKEMKTREESRQRQRQRLSPNSIPLAAALSQCKRQSPEMIAVEQHSRPTYLPTERLIG